MAIPRNPFTPSFGIDPSCFAGRESILIAMEDAFESGLGDPNLCSLIAGTRGSGKTAMLSRIGSAARERNWIVIDVVAAPGMLQEIWQCAMREATRIDASLADALGALPVLTNYISGHADATEAPNEDGSSDTHPDSEAATANWRSNMDALFDLLDDRFAGLLITVDDAKPGIEDLTYLIYTYQLLVRDGRTVALALAGLPDNIDALASNESTAFLSRARLHTLDRIPDADVERAIRNAIEQSGKRIGDEQVRRAAEAAGGSPYLMQLIGYHMWAESGSLKEISTKQARRGVAQARRDFETQVLDRTWREMSKGDRAFAFAMLPDPAGEGSRLTDVAARMGKGTNYTSTYKARLLRQGVITDLPGGTFDFALPSFREFIKNKQ